MPIIIMFLFFAIITIDGIYYHLMSSAVNKHQATSALKMQIDRRRCDIPWEETRLISVTQLNGEAREITQNHEYWIEFQKNVLRERRTNNGQPQPEDFEGGDRHPILIMHKPLPWGGKTPNYGGILTI